MSTNTSHRWKFFRAGGFEQVSINSGEDLLNLRSLDQKLWVALSCPVQGVEFDRKTLECLDTDRDGHIRVPEVLAAIDWAIALLKDPAVLASGKGLPLSAINDASEEGKMLLKNARRMLETLGRSDKDVISAEDTAHLEEALFKKRFNGDGIITVDASDDEQVRAAIKDIIACAGSEHDRSGAPGISRQLFDGFFADVRAFNEWAKKPEQDPALLPLGAGTSDAANALAAVRSKIDDYFLRCELTEYDSRSLLTVNPTPEDYRAFVLQNLASGQSPVSSLPLAVAGPGKALPLREGLHPAWKSAMDSFFKMVITPLLGQRDAITRNDWDKVTAAFAPHSAWLASKPKTMVESLGESRLSAISSSHVQDEIGKLLVMDEEVAEQANSIVSVDRLARYCRDLLPFVNNFTSFRDFYTRKGKAMFQAGTLFLDGRSSDLCVKVAALDSHAVLAPLSRLFLVYCVCRRRGGAETMIIAAAVTTGDSDQLTIGRNGVFYDRDGQDWDSTIVKIIDHPISIGQAFWTPYKRISRMVSEQIQKLAASRSKSHEDRAAEKVGDLAKSAEGDKAPAPASFDVGKFAGIFAAIGLAIGAIGTAIAAIMTGLLRLAWWQVPLVFAGLMLVISGPSMILAWFKLHQRNLGPLLDAGGWAVNARAKINIPFGAQLTSSAQIPEGSDRQLLDPFREKKGVSRYVLAGVVLAIVLAAIYFYLRRR
jgi:hypothetical protein